MTRTQLGWMALTAAVGFGPTILWLYRRHRIAKRERQARAKLVQKYRSQEER